MKLLGRLIDTDDHAQVSDTLDHQEKMLEQHAERLRAIELELGIFNPPILVEMQEDEQ